MERVISAEERIRKAEEIYQRRKNQNSGGVRVSTRNENTGTKREYMLFKKLILQIAICLLIYLIFYLIKNSNYIFSENVINKTREILSYDIDFQKLYTSAEEYYNNNLKGLIVIKNNEETTNEIEHTETNEQAENENGEKEVVEISPAKEKVKINKRPVSISDIHPLWMKHPNECTDEDYKTFYRKVFMDYK